MTIVELKRIIYKDFSRIDKPTLKNLIKHYLVPKGEVYKCVFWMRFVQWSRSASITKYTVGFIFYLLMRKYEHKYGVHINPNIKIGPGLLIVHGDGVHLNASAIGTNCTIYQGVTVGSLHGKIPRIKNNVTIYTNAVVVGDIIIHDGSKIGANTYVSQSVPKNAVVIGEKSRIIHE